MFEVSFSVEGSLAATLSAEQVCEAHSSQTGEHSRTHEDGWTIRGVIVEDYYYWVNDFEAFHPVFGRVSGNFEDRVVAETEAAYAAFYAAHAPEFWDYWDI